MTTIAANLKGIASDSLADDSGTRSYVPKIYEVNGHYIGIAGDYCYGLEFIRWYSNQATHLNLPDHADIQALVVAPEGIFVYENETKQQILDKMNRPAKYWAIGSGQQPALTALSLGKSPIEAIMCAMEIDIGTGGLIQALPDEGIISRR